MPKVNPPSIDADENVFHDDERPLTKRTPLPKLQLFIVCLIQFSEPITATVIYPFINQLVHETGITMGDERKTGYFAGIIVSRIPISLTDPQAQLLPTGICVFHHRSTHSHAVGLGFRLRWS